MHNRYTQLNARRRFLHFKILIPSQVLFFTIYTTPESGTYSASVSSQADCNTCQNLKQVLLLVSNHTVCIAKYTLLMVAFTEENGNEVFLP